jgi:lipoprotein-releasing system ATP-binding protein
MASLLQSLVVQGIAKAYPTPAEPLVVLRDISFRMEPGEALAITGPSGCGKSTLLYILGSLETPTSGTFQLGDEEPSLMTGDQLSTYRNQRVGFVFQDHHLLPQLTALENVLLPSLAQPRSDPEALQERARSLIDRVGMTDRAAHLPSELSGGERQRIAIARALIHRPSMVLADEPTGNLDRKLADEVADLLLQLRQEEESILIVVTHSLDLADRHPRRAKLIDGVMQLS